MEDVKNINETIVERETVVHRIVDRIAAFSGSIVFLILNAIAFTLWIGVNTLTPKRFHYDPYPFNFLTLSVSLEAIFLSIFVLISQNRQAKREKVHEQAERNRQEKLLRENTDLNVEEESIEQELLTLIRGMRQTQEEVKQAQAEHKEILDTLVAALPARKKSRV